MNAIALFAMQALQAVPAIIAAFDTVDKALAAVKEHSENTASAIQRMQAEGRDPTAEEWTAQAAIITNLRAALRAAS